MKKFYRRKQDSLVAGVCTGLGEYFNVPTWLIRLLFILFVSNVSIIIYILIWILSEEV